MARRGNPQRYFVQLDNHQMFRVPAARWHNWVALGLLILVAGRIAKPACPGVVWVENGELHFPPDRIAPWMILNCRQIEQAAIFHDPERRYFVTPEEHQQVIQRQYEGWE